MKRTKTGKQKATPPGTVINRRGVTLSAGVATFDGAQVKRFNDIAKGLTDVEQTNSEAVREEGPDEGPRRYRAAAAASISAPRRGRRGHAATRPELVALAKRLWRASLKAGERRSLRKISAELAKAGYLNERGQPFGAKSIKSMLEQ
jgi:hypothetical protein